MKVFQVKVLNNITGKPFKTYREGSDKPVDGTLVDLLKSLVFALPPARLTMQDSIEARRLYEQLANSGEVLSMEEGSHDWVKKMIEAYAPAIFGVNAIVVQEAINDFERANPKKE